MTKFIFTLLITGGVHTFAFSLKSALKVITYNIWNGYGLINRVKHSEINFF